ncbi:glycosyltransferase family 39 protein [Hymenobacter sp. BT770]|uniref:glycosyltransferase family 39 protein n=1 Tax=Hymenobacter sp. BT770 TaxID=2886942 RepID=UPI001D1028EF|nr:glycosyltransferase family 39 protein [Hymenobacter sp. BT770]MCC3153606.1 glycosyltransferase family 39 protein [Hymenobacter sp. BT770]MDO3415928.1 glycosyltransferase family 39 protein [Hymenobacter sp. BT770]
MRLFSFIRAWGLRLWPHHPAVLAGLWVLVQLVYLRQHHGPHFANDSARYLEYAHDIAERGYFAPGHNLRYVLYPLFQSIWLWLGLGWWGIVAGQMAVSALATRAIYQGTRRLAGGRRAAAALATLLFITWPDIQQFNVFLLTESLFISLVALSFGAFSRVRHGQSQDWAWLIIVLALTALARPNGFMVGLAAGLAGLDVLRRRRDRRPWRAALLLLVLLSPLLWQALNHQLATYYLMDTYQRGELIFRYQLWAVHQAQPLQMPPPGTGPVARVLYFGVHNPLYLGRLMVGKLFIFISYLKPHYSLAHRVVGVLVLWPAYWLAALATRRGAIWRPARVFLAAVFLLQTAIIMLTVDDWDVRFLAPVLSVVFVLAALELTARWRLPAPALSPKSRTVRATPPTPAAPRYE